MPVHEFRLPPRYEICDLLGCCETGSYRRFGKTYWSHFEGSVPPLKTGPTGYPEMLITKNQSKLHNTPEEQILQHAHIDNQDQKNTLIMHHTL